MIELLVASWVQSNFCSEEWGASAIYVGKSALFNTCRAGTQNFNDF